MNAEMSLKTCIGGFYAIQAVGLYNPSPVLVCMFGKLPSRQCRHIYVVQNMDSGTHC